MGNPLINFNEFKEEVEHEKNKYVKRYIQPKDYWAVWKYVFTGKLLDMSWIKDIQ